MADNKKGYRKLLNLRNRFLNNQINFNEFLNELEIILFNYIGVNAVKLAGGNGLYAYSTIARRLLQEPTGKTESLKNLKIDLLYYEI